MTTHTNHSGAQPTDKYPINITRRTFLKSAGIFALNLAFGVDLATRAQAVAAITEGKAGLPTDMRGLQDAVVTLNAWLKIAADGTVTLAIPKADMGQGVRTSLAMLVAEELEVEWGKMQVEQAVLDGAYGNMMTFGSMSIRQMYGPMRLVGATAREILIAAAAHQWGIGKDACSAEAGTVIASDGRVLTYGELAARAATLPVPPRNQVRLKEAAAFKLIGKATDRIDNPAVVSGKAEYGIDVRVPGLLYASVARCPVFGGTVASVDDSAAKAVPGVRAVLTISSGVAVVGETTYAALTGREALKITWDEGEHAALDQAAVWDKLRNADSKFDPDPAGLAKVTEAAYELPYLAHATMEPLNATAHIQADKAEMWVPTQSPDGVQRIVTAKTGLAAKDVTVHTTLLGGGFGRKVEMDYVTEAVEVSMALKSPVQLAWTRADDMQHGAYRPASYHAMRAGLTADGKIAGWQHRLHTQALTSAPGFLAGILVVSGMDAPYAFPKKSPTIRLIDFPIPTGFWRSVYLSQNIFAIESFIDELAALAGEDPIVKA